MLTEINLILLERVCRALGFRTNSLKIKELDLNINASKTPTLTLTLVLSQEQLQIITGVPDKELPLWEG